MRRRAMSRRASRRNFKRSSKSLVRNLRARVPRGGIRA